jgi:hypothetical protein
MTAARVHFKLTMVLFLRIPVLVNIEDSPAEELLSLVCDELLRHVLLRLIDQIRQEIFGG